MLVLDRATGQRRHAHIADLPAFLGAGDLLVVNNTRVIPARLLGRRVPSGGAVECLLLGPAPATESDTPELKVGPTVVAIPTDTRRPDHHPSTRGALSSVEGQVERPAGMLFDALVHPGRSEEHTSELQSLR